MTGDVIIARPRLVRRLDEAVTAAPVTLVSAEAGSGKTTAAGQWYATRRSAKLWLTADATANKTGVLWSAVLAAWPGAGVAMPPRAAAFSKLLPLAAVLPEPTVLVLDDLHEITDPDILAELRYLIDRRPPNLRLLLLSRSDPAMRLERWRLSGVLADVRAADLAFVPDEIAELAGRQGLRLAPGQAADIADRTWGWAAGVRLATAALAGERRDAAAYVLGEVVDGLPTNLREFLVRTSVVDEVGGPFAEALLDDPAAPALLDTVAATHQLLVRPVGQDRVYRYHPLLREALYHDLVAQRPILGQVQHGRAAGWYAERGRWVEAVRHAILSRDADRIERVLLTALPRLFSADADDLVAALHPEGSAGYPHGLSGTLVAAVEHLHGGDLDGLRCDLVRCREQLPRAGSGGMRGAVEAVLRVLDVLVAAGRGDAAELVATAEDAVRRLDAAGPVIGPVVAAYRAVAECHRGIGLLWMMRPWQAESSLRSAMRPALARDLVAVQALGHAYLAWAAAAAGRCRSAELHAAAALRHPVPAGAPAHLALAHVCLLRADFDTAALHVRHWAHDADRGADPLVELAARILEARIHLGRGGPARAEAMLAEVREKAGRESVAAPLVGSWVTSIEADIGLARGAYPMAVVGESPGEQVRAARAELGEGRAGRAVEIAGAVLEAEPELLTEVRARVVDAVAQHRLRHDTAALTAIGEALQAAAGERLVLPFMELPACRDLVRLHRDLGGAHRDFADDLLTTGGTPTPRAVALVEPLTERELIVLRHLPTLRGNTEIGESMFVTVNTVKAHLKAVYRKLGVTNRRAAVEKARELHLL
ncbi:helix-turn-helix transcriptional regulator [Hamadaea tsunoensis]|uniref:helix-turn-helix transcriptional regulator n=1 Tax=Hamadaea tsunoensis TaxID=53368 RepID=UPI0004002E58|nr:LuxR C-terminal-related transcriptional regulator [Hamadaea tsunoensis]